jgi:DNA-binding transcriptional regulator YdaS (Cro superfamily)
MKIPLTFKTTVLYYLVMARKRRHSALAHALKAAGGISALADSLGITKQAVSGWHKCPARRVIDVEKATKGVVNRYRLRPDIFGR